MIKKFTFLVFSVLLMALAQAQPANDNCINSTAVIIPSSGNICVNGTLSGATDDGLFSGCETSGSQEVWFTYIATGPNNIVIATPTGGTPASNLVVSLKTVGCNNNTISACNAASTAGGAATATWAVPAGTQVWVFVSSATNSGGTFQLCVGSTITPATTGKDCSTAAPMCTMNSFTATVAPGSNGFQPPCFTGAMQQPIIFAFTVGQGGLLNWRATPTCGAPNPNTTEFDWAVYDITGGCPGVRVACNYNFTGGFFTPSITAAQGMQGGPAGTGCNNTAASGNAALEICQGVNVTAGSTYVIMIDQYTPGSTCTIDFNFTGSTFTMAPTSAFTVSPSSGCGSVTASFTNNSVGATGATPYSWSFGDATTSTVQNPPAKTYSTPGTYLVSLTTQSATGCTQVTSQSVQVFASPTLTTVSDTICTGLQATISATASTPGGTYSWSNGAGNTASVNVSPGATTTYTVTYTSADNCTATATATVTVSTSNYTVNAGTDTTICGNQAINLNGSVTPAGNYTYSWTGGPINSGSTTLTPSVMPSATTTYTLAVTDAGGCTKTDAVQVSVNGIAVPVTVTANPMIICPGQQVQLAASILPVTCGYSPTCAGNLATPFIGSDSIPQPGTALQAPTLFGNFVRSGRNQMLYTAAEINAAMGGPAIIKAVTFWIKIFNGNPQLQNFTIKMGCTNLTSLTTWQNNLITVYSAASYQPIANFNGFLLQNAFSWDGTSNLIIDICWYNPNTFGAQNNKAACTTTPFTSYLYSVGTPDQCPGPVAPTTSTLRPNVRFNYCAPDLDNYTVVWTPSTGPNAVSNPAIDSPTTSPIVTTLYNVSISNGPTCPGTGNVTVQVDNSSVSAGPDRSSCPNAPVALSATVTGTPLPGPASFVWTTLAGTNVGNTQNISVSPTVNTTYVVTMNGGACVRRDTVVVTIGSITPTATPTNATCFGANNGSILAASTQGTSPFNYTWSANAATGNLNTASNLGPGTYQVTVSDATGCSGTASATITQPTQLTFTTTILHDSCFGEAQGTITANPSGGTGAYTYAWSNGQTGQTATGLVAGAYTVTVRDANLCSATSTVVVLQPSQINFLGATIQNVRCFNESTGSITVSNNGGTAPYTYTWAPGVLSTTATANNLAAGTYTVTVHDSYYCTATATYNVTQPATGLQFAPPVVTNPSCFNASDGTATVNAAGGVGTPTYLWTPTGQTTATATGLSAQTYTVVATDDSSCTATTTVTPVNPPQVQVTGVVTDVNCFGASDGAIDVTVTNAVPTVTYAWFTGQNTQDISGIPQGSYTVTVTDGNNCTAIGSFVVNEPAALVLTQPTIVQVLCFGGNTGSITVNNTGGTGPFSYTWNPVGPNAVTYSGLTAGSYDVTITDDNGCTDNATYQVTQPASALAFAPAVIVDVACSGAPTGSITVSVSGGTTTSPYSYSWSHNAGLNNPVASGLTAGQYTVTVTDANGCTLTQTNTVNEPTPVTFGPPTIVNVTCAGGNDGSVAYNPTGGTGAYTYTWNGVAGTNPQTGLAANSYTVVITDASGCTFSATVTVSEPAPLVIAPVATDATCNGAPNGSIDANISGGTTPYQPVWSNGETTEQIFGLLAGLYTITVTDGNGCTASSGANVNEPLQLSFFLNAEQVKCPGDQNGSIEIVNTTGGTPPYNYAATMDGANFFYPGNIPTKIEGLASGNYAVILSDGNGCTLVDTAFVPAPIGDTYSYTTDSTSCYGKEYTDGGIHVTGFTLQNMPYQFSVDGGLLQYSGDFYGLAAGPHTVLAQNYFGCDTSFTVVIPEPVDAFAEALPGDTTIGLGESIQLSSAFGPYPTSTIVSYSWSPTLGLSCIDCANPIATPYARETEYLLTITYNDHCIATAGMTVVVDGGEPVFIPNSFSPNGDGNNDVFQIYGVGIKTIELKIFNRWGEKVYESNNQFEGWDGTYKGTIQQPAVFVYHVTVTYLNDKKMQKVGSITLIK